MSMQSTPSSADTSTTSPSPPWPMLYYPRPPQDGTILSSSPHRAPHTPSPIGRSFAPAGTPWASPAHLCRGPDTLRSTTSLARSPLASSPPPSQPVSHGPSRIPPTAAMIPLPPTGNSTVTMRHSGCISTSPAPSATRMPSCAHSPSARSTPHSRNGPPSPIRHPSPPSFASSTSTPAVTAARSISLGPTAWRQTATVCPPPPPPIPRP